MIKTYFKKIISILENKDHIIERKSVSTKEYSDTKGFISGEVDFIDESRLDFIEVVDVEKNLKTKYKYHYMDDNSDMVFRYDNAPHYRNLNNFLHHKHTAHDVIESTEPNLEIVLDEIEIFLSASPLT